MHPGQGAASSREERTARWVMLVGAAPRPCEPQAALGMRKQVSGAFLAFVRLKSVPPGDACSVEV